MASATSSDALFENHSVWLKGMRGMLQNLSNDEEQVQLFGSFFPQKRELMRVLQLRGNEWTQRLELMCENPLRHSCFVTLCLCNTVLV